MAQIINQNSVVFLTLLVVLRDFVVNYYYKGTFLDALASLELSRETHTGFWLDFCPLIKSD